MDIMKASLLKKIKEMADMVVNPAVAADVSDSENGMDMDSMKHEMAEEQKPHEGMSGELMDSDKLQQESDLAPNKEEQVISEKDKKYKKQIEEMKKSFDPFKKKPLPFSGIQ